MSDPRVVTVYVVDDHDIIREGIVSIIRRERDLQVIGHAPTVRAARATLIERYPDVLIVNETASDEARRAVLNGSSTIVLLLDDADDTSSDGSGAARKFSKASEPRALVAAVRQAAGVADRPPPDRPVGGLPPHLRRILVALAEGRQARDIAAALDLSVHTVKTYLRQVYSELGTTNRAQTVATAMRLGML